jgi:hypothetical protein
MYSQNWHVPELGQGWYHRIPVRMNRTLKPTDMTRNACLSAMSVTQFANISSNLLLPRRVPQYYLPMERRLQWRGTAYRKLNYVITNTVTLLTVLHDIEAWLEHTKFIFRSSMASHPNAVKRCHACFSVHQISPLRWTQTYATWTSPPKHGNLWFAVTHPKTVLYDTYRPKQYENQANGYTDRQSSTLCFLSCPWSHPVA